MKLITFNNYHSIMFHHFHNDYKHKKSQGSISAKEFQNLLDNIDRDKILNPDEFISKVKSNTLKKNDICLSFDDGLKSQFDIAFPILEKNNLKAFFFVYSKFKTKEINIESLRYFRENYFKNINEYYEYFFHTFEKYSKIEKEDLIKKKQTYISHIKNKFKFYSTDDIIYRHIRDNKDMSKYFIKTNNFLFDLKKFNYENSFKKLYMSKNDLKKLNKFKHYIGLHSHTHPTNMKLLSYKNQFNEFKKNKKFINQIIDKNIEVSSYPCGSHNSNTIKALKKLGVTLAFIQIRSKKFSITNTNRYKIPRIDHTDLKYLMK